MERYITKRAAKIITAGDIVVLVLAALFAAASVSVMFDSIREGKSLAAIIVFVILFVWLFVARCRRILRKRQAYRIASRMCAMNTREISFKQAIQSTKDEKCISHIEKLVQLDFLTGIQIDHSRSVVIMTYNKELQYVQIRCPFCGGTNKILSGTVSECEYCNAKISE